MTYPCLSSQGSDPLSQCHHSTSNGTTYGYVSEARYECHSPVANGQLVLRKRVLGVGAKRAGTLEARPELGNMCL